MELRVWGLGFKVNVAMLLRGFGLRVSPVSLRSMVCCPKN